MVGYTITWTLSGGEDTEGNLQKYPSKTPSPAVVSVSFTEQLSVYFPALL